MFVSAIIAFILNSAAVVWIGGTFLIVYLSSKALKSKSDGDLAVLMRSYAHLSRGIFLPASLAVLVLGLYLAVVYWGIFTFWTLFSLILAGGSIALGQMILGPMLKEWVAMEPVGAANPEATALAERIVAVGKTDLVLLFGLVLTATMKAGWTNWLTWIVTFLLVLGGLFVFKAQDLLPGQQTLERTRDFGDEPEPVDDDEIR